MTNRERIEAYFYNQLSITEKESLLRDIESDPSLKTEFDFQNEVLEGIQNYRKQELITRLNNVEVASVGTSTLTKIIGAIGVATIVTSGLYWYFGSEIALEVPENNIEVVEEAIPENDVSQFTAIEKDQAKDISLDNAGDEEKSEEILAETNEPMIKTTETRTSDAKVPVMVEPDTEGIAAVEDDHDAPELLKSEGLSVSSSADVEVRLDKRYNFHYQVVNGDLTLFGDFNKSKFEVIELKTNLGIKLYLYYNERYFELKSDSSEIKPLVPVDNTAVISELDKRRQ